MNTLKKRIIAYAKKEYGTVPDRPFSTAPSYEVLRHGDSGKWYALFMDVPRARLGLAGDDMVDIINLKCDPILAGALRDGVGIFPGYHLNHDRWISVLLDGTVAFRDIRPLVELSYELTGGGKGARARGGSGDWLIPANPRFYDIDAGFADSADGTILWKQTTNVRVGDRVYIYVAAPVSAILYKCEVSEVNVPYEYADGNVSMSRCMRLRLSERYDGVKIGRDIMQKHDVHAVRGARTMPKSLIEEIEMMYRA